MRLLIHLFLIELDLIKQVNKKIYKVGRNEKLIRMVEYFNKWQGYIFMREYLNEIRSHALLDIHEIFCLSRVSVIVFVRRNGLKPLLGIPKQHGSS